jgi:shikimate dehydrogenase
VKEGGATLVTVETKLVGLLGYPLKQTFSPQMQNEAFQKLGLDYFYFPIEVQSEGLREVINGIKHMNFAGFNVTKPHKVTIIPMLDVVNELAAKIGSVNTVVIREGKLTGYNTDGEGFVRALLTETSMDLTQKTFTILGAGGASRAVCSTLAFKGASKLYIVDQFSEVSSAMVQDVNSNIRFCAEGLPFDEKAIAGALENSQVLINASGVGMYPHLEKTPIHQDYLRKELLVVDLPYNPLKTRLLLEAEAKGCKIMNGIGMIINQGALAFSLWTGLPEPLAIMQKTIGKLVH